jgi:O6-methylguanine-DNA--protein-cysteine methyltransferase
MRYGFHASPFGTALVMATERGLCGLAFADAGEEAAALEDMRARWPNARYMEDKRANRAPMRGAFSIPPNGDRTAPLRVVLIGTNFEVKVWETLLAIPLGRATTYSDIARKVCRKSRARGGRRGRQEPDFLRRAVPSRARQERRAHRLSLGTYAEESDARLGSGEGGFFLSVVMAGLVAAIHAFESREQKDVDARDKRGHDKSRKVDHAARSSFSATVESAFSR